MPEKPTLLVVDDEESLRTSLRLALKSRFQVHTARNSVEAFDIIRAKPVQLAIVDIKMANENGLDLLKDIKAHDPLIEVIILTGFSRTEFLQQAWDGDAAFFHQKPFDFELLISQIDRALRFRASCEATVTALQQRDQDQEVNAIQDGIVHDMRNTLTVALCHGEMLYTRLSSRGQLSQPELFAATKDLEVMLSHLRISVVLTSRHMRIVRAAKGTADNFTDDLATLIRDLTVSLASHSGIRGTRFISRCQPENLPNPQMAMVDLFQILLNLCINAAQASATNPQVSVEARMRLDPLLPEELTDTDTRRVIGADNFPASDPVLCISVADNGTGFQPAILQKIFSTPVTSKGPGVGTGIGLYSVGKIVKRNSGVLVLESFPGKGSRISLFLKIAC